MYEQLRTGIAGLVIFGELKHDPVLRPLFDYFRYTDEGESISAAESYAEFTRALLGYTDDLSEYLYRRIVFSDNIFIRRYFDGRSSSLERQVTYELDFLGKLAAALPSSDKAVDGLVFPEISASPIDLMTEYIKALPDAAKRGVGIFAEASMFRVADSGELIPVKTSDSQNLSDLVGYERERRRVLENTETLMSGGKASNALLYGDAGTGKSSTVKAIVNKFASDGLRLIELEPSQVGLIPGILEKIAAEPLKFIIFIDDLTLSPSSPELCTLKTVLEGGTGTDRCNSVIYVTSNHRHLVKESAADRDGGEVNIQDNLQGVLGLSARFGLTVTFLSPDRELYLDIVKKLARDKGIEPDEALLGKAEAFAIRRNGRTPRCAKQFVELAAAGIDPIK